MIIGFMDRKASPSGILFCIPIDCMNKTCSKAEINTTGDVLFFAYQ